jgi:hypothetical protein
MASKKIKLPSNVEKDLETLIDYAWEDELKGWLGEGRPKNHFFKVLMRLCDSFGIYYDEQDFDSVEADLLETKKRKKK